MCREESKVGKGGDRKNQLWENRGNRVKGGGWAWRAGRSGHVCPCPVLGACSWFWLLFKLHFYLLSRVRALYASVWVSVCAGGAECRTRGPWPTAEETTGPGGQLGDPFLCMRVCVCFHVHLCGRQRVRSQGSCRVIRVSKPVHTQCVSVPMWGSTPAAGVGPWPQGLACPHATNSGDWDAGTAPEQTECLSPVAGGSTLCIRAAYVCLCVCLRGIHAQPCYWLELEAWSCSSLLRSWIGKPLTVSVGMHSLKWETPTPGPASERDREFRVHPPDTFHHEITETPSAWAINST